MSTTTTTDLVVKPEPQVPASGENMLDPRRNAYREDLAANNIRNLVQAPRYVDGDWAQVRHTSVMVRRHPQPNAPVDTEALFGEVVVVYDVADGWAWVQLVRDRYVGYVRADALSENVEWPTHKVRALGTFIYPEPDIKSPPLTHLSLNSGFAIADMDEQFCKLKTGGYVVSRHVAEEGAFSRDFVEVAERFIGTPYLWGGRTRLGIDCSGLVQLSLEAAGISAPRDSDMQQAELGANVLVPEDLDGLLRGDLIFWAGHVGILVDGIMLLHANAHHMAVTVETLPEAVERIARGGSKITAIKRLTSVTA
ncbi:Peptidase P60 [Candidatus Filomicrobium marinum]|uniref:Peptidase P60 n=2 Tax=Filomicrobium TaxID=119044 RepID=A0A0D6JFM0_9HYPH|nr:Peptidase P60 [Candidatus Filomicrobium marinum]CPR18934.1 Peptidase P60 [Candidatus Filomicrobium marinum]SDO12362.1 NlpC/P60 family protein [Filomicrobium insigne]